MFTVCPKCALNLAVTAADLRMGQGYVRCGRCANVFNALLGLSEESHDLADALTPTASTPSSLASAPTPPAAPPPPSRAHEPEAPADQKLDDAEQDMTLPGVRLTAPPAPPAPPAPSSSPPALRLIESPPRPAPIEPSEPEEFRATGTFETIVLEGDTFLQTEELVPEEAFDIEVAAVSQRLEAARSRGFGLDALAAEAGGPPAAPPAPQIAAPRTDALDHEPDSGDAPTLVSRVPAASASGSHALAAQADEPPPGAVQFVAPRRPIAWRSAAGLVLLGLLFVAQAADHWRNDLVTRPELHDLVTRLCGALGRPLAPNWDLAAYDVRQLGAGADPGDSHTIRVRLALANHARGPQAFPLVRLTLLDRYGKSLSAGELQPAQYLPAALRNQRTMAPDQRIDTEVGIADATQQATSFELDVCTAAAGGGVRCAGDGAPASGGATP